MFPKTIFLYLGITLMQRQTKTILYVPQEATIDDYLNMDGDKIPSETPSIISLKRYVLTRETLGLALGVIQAGPENQRNPNSVSFGERSIE